MFALTRTVYSNDNIHEDTLGTFSDYNRACRHMRRITRDYAGQWANFEDARGYTVQAGKHEIAILFTVQSI